MKIKSRNSIGKVHTVTRPYHGVGCTLLFILGKSKLIYCCAISWLQGDVGQVVVGWCSIIRCVFQLSAKHVSTLLPRIGIAKWSTNHGVEMCCRHVLLVGISHESRVMIVNQILLVLAAVIVDSTTTTTILCFHCEDYCTGTGIP